MLHPRIEAGVPRSAPDAPGHHTQDPEDPEDPEGCPDPQTWWLQYSLMGFYGILWWFYGGFMVV